MYVQQSTSNTCTGSVVYVHSIDPKKKLVNNRKRRKQRKKRLCVKSEEKEASSFLPVCHHDEAFFAQSKNLITDSDTGVLHRGIF